MKPSFVDKWTGYRYYTTEQLYDVQMIVAFRQAGLSIDQIKAIKNGDDALSVLSERKSNAEKELAEASHRVLFIDGLIQNIKENRTMKYQAIIKEIPSYTVFYKRGIVKNFSEIIPFILGAGEECKEANPTLKCIEPDYCYVAYLNSEFKDEDISVEYAQAVEKTGVETDTIKFRELSKTQAVCVYHKGSYKNISEAYAFAFDFVKKQGYEVKEAPREHYIDGMWNKDDENDWLTEIQIPVIK